MWQDTLSANDRFFFFCLIVVAGLRRVGAECLQPQIMSYFLARTIVDCPQITHCIVGHFEDAVEYSVLVCTGSNALELYRESSAGTLTKIHRQSLNDDIVDLSSIPSPASSCRHDVKKVSVEHQCAKDQDVECRRFPRLSGHVASLPMVILQHNLATSKACDWRRGWTWSSSFSTRLWRP